MGRGWQQSPVETANLNKYDRYPGDYLRDTLTLSMMEDGAYCRLLDIYYASERPIADSTKYAATRAISVAEKRATNVVLQRFFRLEDRNGNKVWVNPRAEKEIQAKAVRVAVARANGRGGGRPRKNPDETDLGTHEKPSRLSDGNPNPNPEKSLPPSTVHRFVTGGEDPKDLAGSSASEPQGFSPPPDRFIRSFGPVPSAKRDDVQRVHRERLRVFNLGPKTALVVAHNTDDADRIAAAIDAHGEADVMAMLRYAPSDPMVSGRADDKGLKHESIRYLFGENLSRLIRDAKTKTKTTLNGAASASEIERRKREE